jgi:uncharacterized RDD family membrane protein YckC
LSQTRFFCRCGRLLTVDASTREVVCPTCRERNTVPQLGMSGDAGAPPLPPLPSSPPSGAAAPRAAAPAPVGPSAATAVLEPLLGGKLGRFELVRMLGQGGMGTVYHARDGGHDVALKLLHPALQGRSDFVSRFQREARAVTALRHENIVRVLDSGVERSTPWIAMELVDGEDLLAAGNSGTVNAGNATQMMLQAARGLEAAAQVGLTHRDIKPGNLVLRKDGVLKIADFGLAKAVDSSTHLTVTGEILGTPHYMAPEQGRGERADHRSDLYSLGATFYHVLGGAPPHEAETPVGVIMKHLREEPLPLRSRAPQVSPGLERIIHRLLQKSPDSRYQTYSALIADLERVAEGREPIGGADPPMRRVQDGDTTYVLPHESATELVLKPAGAIRRFAAFLIDVFAVELALRLFVVAGRVMVGAGVASAGSGGPLERLHRLGSPDLHCDQPWKTVVLASGCALAAFLYLAFSDAQGGRTIGKKWFNLRLCRRDGRDLGVLRATVRTLVLLPGVALLMPTLAGAVRELLICADAWPSNANAGGMAGAGLAWLVALELLGRMSPVGRPLQDAIVGAVAWKAQRYAGATPVPAAAGARMISPRRAVRLSIVPGLGVMYAGHMLLGMLFLALTIFALARLDDVRPGLALWVASAFAARWLAARRQRLAVDRAAALAAPETKLIRRQES